MFEQVDLDQLPSLAPLFDRSHRLRMVISSIAAGNSSACLYRASGGGLYLLWDQGNNVFYAAGTEPPRSWEGPLDELVRESIIPMFAAADEEYFSIDIPDAPGIEEQLRAAFSPYLKWEQEKLFFAHPGSSEIQEPPHRTDGVTFVPIHRSVLGSEGPTNREIVRSEILYMWPSLERFLSRGWGTAALLDDRIVGWCTAEYVGPAQAGIGIETERGMRRQGIATAAGTVFLQQCQQHKRRPHWECDAANEASVRLAERLGFRLVQRRNAVSGLFPVSGEG